MELTEDEALAHIKRRLALTTQDYDDALRHEWRWSHDVERVIRWWLSAMRIGRGERN